MPFSPNSWEPRTILRFIGSRPTGASVVIVETDYGEGFLKGLGNEAGPHALACELVGSLAADWLGLQTLDFALVTVDSSDELHLAKGGVIQPGPAFITKRAEGFPWGGDEASLSKLVNEEDLTRLVILDTWILNCDRHSIREAGPRVNRDNVFLCNAGGSGALRLLAIDHTHAFSCGRDLTVKMNRIAAIQDNGLFGLFPEFFEHWNLAVASETLSCLAAFDYRTAASFIAKVPLEWEVDASTRSAWADFMVQRAHWLAAKGASNWLSIDC